MSKNYFHSVFKNAFVALVLLVGHVALAQTVQTFNTPGTGTFTVPAGVTEITVETWGSGGRGVSASCCGTISVTPGQQIIYTVGAGSTSTAAGGASQATLNSSVFVRAVGGNSVGDNSTPGGSGGAASAGIGLIRFSGGAGASQSSDNAGGGGSSAGVCINGNNASGSAGASAPAGGGNGGSGVTSGSGSGGSGQAPGGGGSRRQAFGGNPAGGAGGNGRVRLTYDIQTNSINDGALELSSVGNNPTGNGPVTSATVQFSNNTNNPLANTFSAYTPSVEATVSLVDQQFNFAGIGPSAAVVFGYANGSAPIYTPLNVFGMPIDAYFTSTSSVGGTGISVTQNRALAIQSISTPLRTAGVPTNQRVRMADMLIEFNTPLTGPILHLGGLGGAAGTLMSVELDLIDSDVPLSLERLSGSPVFIVSGNQINHSQASPGAEGPDASSGSVLLKGENITSVRFRTFLRGDGTGQWATNTTDPSGDGCKIYLLKHLQTKNT